MNETNKKKRGEGICLVCGKPVRYYTEAVEMKCVFCGKTEKSLASCEDGHYVCDECHSARGIEAVLRVCKESDSCDPIAIAKEIMEDPYVYMHGPEHHVMVGASLITAYCNSRSGSDDLKQAICGEAEPRDTKAALLNEMRERGSQYPGGSCGFWGCCGAAVSTGMFVSIVTGATPLATESWGLANEMTSRSLARIASYGGPRCCKRNSFTAILEGASFAREKLGAAMELPERVVCGFSHENRECLGRRCPYNRANNGGFDE